MSNNSSVKANAVLNAILTVSTVLFQVITFPYISRVLGPIGTGKVSFATSLISYFVMFAQLGIPTYGIRACAKVRDNKEQLTKITQELLIINLLMSVIAYIVFFVLLFFVPRLKVDKGLYLITSSSILLTSIGMEWLYKALEKYKYITIRSVVFKFFALVFTLLLVKSEKDYLLYGILSIFASSASFVMNFFHARKFISLRPIGNYNFRPHLKAVMVFFAMACATTVYTHLDTVMLGFMKTDEDVGYYNAAVKIKTVLVHLVTSLGAVLLPRSSYYLAKGMTQEFYKITRKAVNFVFLFSLPLSIYFILYAKQGILFLSGPAFEGSILAMQIIMPTLFFIGITNILGMQMLVPLGREKIVLYSVIVGAFVDLILNVIFIPSMAAAGAAIGTLVAEVSVLIVQVFAMRNEIKDSFKDIHPFMILFSLIFATVGSLWVIRLEYSNFVTLILSSILFFGIYGIILIIFKEPLVLELSKQIIARIVKKRH